MGSFQACAYPAGWRLVAAAAFVASRASLPAILFAILDSRLSVEASTVVRWFVLFCALPALAATVIARALTARLRVGDDTLTIARAGLQLDIPHGAIARVAPWWLPVPSPGFGLGLASGRRLAQGIGIADPVPVLRTLMQHGVAAAETAA